MDVTVTDLKAVYVVDRSQKKIIRYTPSNITGCGIWPNNTMADGINDENEVVDLLGVLESRRRQVNEDADADYDFILGIVDRREVHMNWGGVAGNCCSSAVLISVGDNAAGAPAYDVGSIIGHELLHLHDVDDGTADKRTVKNCSAGQFD